MKNNSKICDFLLRGQEVLGGPFQGVLARSCNYLKVDTMKERSSHHFLPTICEKNHKVCVPLHTQTIIQA
jgi:hypothetical protein